MVVIDHPFWDFYEKAVRRRFKPGMPQEVYDRLRDINCKLFPENILRIAWRGMEIRSPRPPSLVGRDAHRQDRLEADVLLSHFFEMVESGETFRAIQTIREGQERSTEDRIGEASGHDGEDVRWELLDISIQDRIGKSSGLHYNFETAYWTFLAKWDEWTRQNEDRYGCPLVCHLDSIFAHFNVALRSHFFRILGPFDPLGWLVRISQKHFLKAHAPSIADRLYADFHDKSRR